MKLYIKQIGITQANCDAIVNAANSSLAKGGGVCGAIFNTAGSDSLTKACYEIGHCNAGNAVITPGFNLSKYIIHAVGPIYQDGNHNEPKDLYNCYTKSLDLSYEYNCKSIAFPLISAGIYGYPIENAIRIALKACKDWNEKNNNPNIIIVFTIPESDKYQLTIRVSKEYSINILDD